MNMKSASGATLAVATVASLLALGACSREADRSARADAGSTRSQTSVATARADYGPSASSDDARRPASNDGDVRKVDDGKPEWASNRTRGGEDNAQKQFDRNGSDFAAASLGDYVKKAHAFVDAPPKGVVTVSRRNGDVLYYDAKSNVFAVADRQGAPRTMFKPRDGMSYWLQQKQRAAEADRQRGSSQDSGSNSSRYASRGGRSGSDDGNDG